MPIEILLEKRPSVLDEQKGAQKTKSVDGVKEAEMKIVNVSSDCVMITSCE